MIGMLRLDRQRDIIRDDLDRRIARVLDHGGFIAGPEVAEFEDALAAYVGKGEVISCASGTDAIVLALMAHGIGVGDAVFVPSLTFIASASAICLVGATPIFVDIDEEMLTLCVVDLQRKHAQVRRDGALKPRAVIAVDLFGMPAHYDRLGEFCSEASLVLIADAAQSFGGSLDGDKIGSLADVTCLSFYPSKGLGCYGDGGAVTTADPMIASRLRSLRWHGTEADKSVCERIGLNSRLDSIQASVLLAKLAHLDTEIARKKEIAVRYRAAFLPHMRGQKWPDNAEPSWGYFCLILEKPAILKLRLLERGIQSIQYYTTPLHRMSTFSGCPGVHDLPATERCAERLLALPMDGYLADEEVDQICDVLATASD
jgi:UDP-2-acetamido-2-deoxy-ribo-hexuluronate aminotransferase